MKQVIRSVTEVNSMRPIPFYVGQTFQPNVIVDRIELGLIRIEGDPFEYYIGYDKHGDKIFEFPKGSVSVMYEFKDGKAVNE